MGLQPDHSGFGFPVALRGKAPGAGNGQRPRPGPERCSRALRERLKSSPVSVHGSVPAVVKGGVIRGESGLALNADGLTEFEMTGLKDH